MVAIRTLTVILTYAIGLCGILPLFPWLAALPRSFIVLGLLAGLWQDRKGSWRLKPWLQNMLIVPVFCYFAIQFSRTNPVEPVISVLVIMLAVRLGGEKTIRHCLQIYALSMFCLASSSLFDLSPVFLIYLGLLLFLVALALVLLTFQNQDSAMLVSRPDLKRILIFALMMPILAVPLLLFFFPIMPRTQMPLWHILTPAATRSTGYSDTVEPGSQSSISESHTLAFRAEMVRLTQSQLYWRGTVFNHTDGIRWTRTAQVPTEQVQAARQTVTQVIYPEPSTSRTLVALDRPAVISVQRVVRSQDGVYEVAGTVGRRLSYNAASHASGLMAQRNSVNRQFYLQLPDMLPIRINKLATEIVNSGKDGRTRVNFLENYFRTGGYRYSTRDLATGDRAIEQFVFEKKQGNCEFFASAFALLLRAAGVPSRIVGGYLGGEYNQLGGYYLLTDDKAHVWVEAYIEGDGWVRIDPSGFASNAGEVWIAPGPRSLLQQVSQTVDSFNHKWNRMVITYDFEQQMKVASHVTSRLQGIDPSLMLRRFIPFLLCCLAIVVISGAAKRFLWYRHREQRILQRFLRMVEDLFGISTGTGKVGLFELALSADNEHVSAFVDLYADAVYHDRRLTNDEYVRLQLILRDLQQMKTKKILTSKSISGY